MANTLNLGTDGNWATKEDSLLAYNSENGNFKPLPFDFTRASSATVVNKAGLIETVGSGEPRIDFKDDAKGALKLEPTRSNNYTYSEDFSQSTWNKINVNVSSNAVISPDGTLNASKIMSNATAAQAVIIYDNSIPNGNVGSEFTISCYFKASEVEWVQLFFGSGSVVGGNLYANFNIVNGTLGTVSSGLSVSTEESSNGFYKITIKGTANQTTVSPYFAAAKTSMDTRSMSTNNWNVGDGFFMWGAQFEPNSSYATSYIPTSGSAVTRSADVCNNGGNEQVINSTEGVLYVETSALSNDLSERRFGLSDGTSSNVVRVGYTSVSNRIIAVIYNGSNQAVMTYTSSDITQKSKIAVKYKENDFALWVDGVERSTDTSGSVFSANTLNSLDFNIGGGSHFYSKTKDVRIYNTALTDTELQALTT